MPTARRTRTIAAPPNELWSLVRDPHHLPRWWPRVTRVEDVAEDAFTEVMLTRKGKVVRADFNVMVVDEQRRTLTWAQRIQGTPFARLLTSAETEVHLVPSAPARGGSSESVHEGADPVPSERLSARARGGSSESVHEGAGPVPSDGLSARARGESDWTEVTIELRQTLTGLFPRLGGFMVRRAAAATIDEALDGLERIGA